MGYDDKIAIVKDELAQRKKTHGADTMKSSCPFENHAVDYKMFVNQMTNYRDKCHDTLYFPSNYSHGANKFTRQAFLEKTRETMISCDEKWFTYDGGSPVIIFYLTGVGGRDKRTN